MSFCMSNLPVIVRHGKTEMRFLTHLSMIIMGLEIVKSVPVNIGTVALTSQLLALLFVKCDSNTFKSYFTTMGCFVVFCLFVCFVVVFFCNFVFLLSVLGIKFLNYSLFEKLMSLILYIFHNCKLHNAVHFLVVLTIGISF